MKPYIIPTGRGRLILNRCGDKCSVTLDIDGTGITQFLDAKQALELSAMLTVMAKELGR